MKYKYEIRKVDAWAEPEPNAWTYNQTFHLGYIEVDENEKEETVFRKWMDENLEKPDKFYLADCGGCGEYEVRFREDEEPVVNFKLVEETK